MDRKRGKRMKVRLEIIDEDGMESTSVEFGGKHWKKCILAFIDSLADEDQKYAESSSDSLLNSSFSHVQQSSSSTVQQPGTQQPVQQQAIISQPFMQQQMPALQQPVHTAPVQQPVPYYAPHMASPYYYYGQPAQPISSIIQQPMTQSPSAQPAVPSAPMAHQSVQQPVVQTVPARRSTPRLQERINDSSLTINERLELFLKYEYPRVWFSSQDVQQHYERIYGSIKQSTVSTYLSRMYRKNILERRGNRTQREYRYIADEVEMPFVSSGTVIPEFQRI